MEGNIFNRKKKPFYARLRQLSIRRRLLVVIIIQALVVVLLSNFIIAVSFMEYEQMVQSSNARMISSIIENVRLSAISLDAVTKYPIIRADKPPFTYYYLSYPDFYNQQHYEYVRDVQNNAQRLLLMYPSVSNIAVYDVTGVGLYLKSGDMTVLNTVSDPQNDWYTTSLKARGRLCLWDEAEFSPDEDFYGKDYLYATRAIVNVERVESVGLIIANTDLGANVRTFERGRMFEQQRIGVFDEQGNRVMGTLPQERFEQISHQMESLSQASNSDSVYQLSVSVDGVKMIYNFSNKLDGYRCIIETPSALVSQGSIKKQSGTLLLFGCALLLILITTNQIIVSITRPIVQLTNATNKVKSGDFSLVLPDEGADELSLFTSSFNAMTHQINKLVYEVHVKEMESVDLELQMLRMQINPHFLYNSLESIRAEADFHNQQTLSEMSMLLGKVLRYGVTNPSEIVPLKSEVENLNNYIQLQRLRYGSRLDFVVTIEDALMEHAVIKLFLQPMVENAIYHGIDAGGTNGRINVLGYIEAKTMVFNVIDNGVGMDADTVQNINAYLRGENQLFSSIGLKNVHRRIQLFYGEEYGVNIQSKLGWGTKVIITLPLLPEMEDRHV